jgi:hypothetical protein
MATGGGLAEGRARGHRPAPPPQHDLGRRVKTSPPTATTQVKAALAGTKFEVVFDNVYDWERGTTAAQVGNRARDRQPSSPLYFHVERGCHGDGLNHHEGDALAPTTPPIPTPATRP